jgi:hypothetical protein
MVSYYPAIFKQLVTVILLLASFLVIAKRPEFAIELKNHLFFPAEIEIPENTKVKLIIYNRDQTPEEFDSFDLNREKVIFPEKKSIIFIGPLPPGRYEFFGEFNPNSAKGAIIVTQKNSAQKTARITTTEVNIRRILLQNTMVDMGVSYVD